MYQKRITFSSFYMLEGLVKDVGTYFGYLIKTKAKAPSFKRALHSHSFI